MKSQVRHVSVAVSADAFMLQWAREEHAPAGSAVVVDTEIAPRTRGGARWTRADSLTIAVLARPRTLEPNAADLGWFAAGVGAAGAFDDLTAERYVCKWPDQVESSSPTGDRERPEAVISVLAQLGPGRVELVIAIARISGVSRIQSASLIPVTVEHLRNANGLLDEPDRVVSLYRERCATLGERVAVALLRQGSIQGLACDVGNDGSLVVESATGMREHVSVAALDHVSPIPR